ncbi:cytoplasmic protein [Actinoplanes sp. CA-030573]|uniref:cytoplasmic protein n=1 Tax=Actinoplanes sp. CA-030573 TaxID=3239898 RepID=UPI003D8F25E1
MDPTVVSPELYRVVLENDRVRVLAYRDRPGDRTRPHTHPDSVMVTLSSFRRRITSGERSVEVELGAGEVRWLGAQEHSGENIGDTETVSIFVELKGDGPSPDGAASLGPTP